MSRDKSPYIEANYFGGRIPTKPPISGDCRGEAHHVSGRVEYARDSEVAQLARVIEHKEDVLSLGGGGEGGGGYYGRRAGGKTFSDISQIPRVIEHEEDVLSLGVRAWGGLDARRGQVGPHKGRGGRGARARGAGGLRNGWGGGGSRVGGSVHPHPPPSQYTPSTASPGHVTPTHAPFTLGPVSVPPPHLEVCADDRHPHQSPHPHRHTPPTLRSL